MADVDLVDCDGDLDMLLGSDGSANPAPLDAGDSTFPTSIRMPDSIWHHVDVLDRGADVKGDGTATLTCCARERRASSCCPVAAR